METKVGALNPNLQNDWNYDLTIKKIATDEPGTYLQSSLLYYHRHVQLKPVHGTAADWASS
jgi:hypothetical protein